jgi:quercetin dioxygenase-like cupin family protein
MQLRKYRWSKHYESAEEELTNQLQTKNIQAERRHIEEFEELPSIQHDSDSRLWCAEGSMIVDISGKRMSLQPGDTLDVPAGSSYVITAGMTGAVFYAAIA